MLQYLQRLDRVLAFLTVVLGAVWLVAAANAAPAAVQVKSVYIPTRGTAVRVLLMAPENPKAGIVVLPGGHGDINLDVQGQIGWGADQPVIAVRGALVASGYALAIVDVAVDREPPASLKGYHASPAQAEDIAAVAKYLRAYAQPLFLLAFDAGAVSAVNVARQRPTPDSATAPAYAGMILVAPTTVVGRRDRVPLEAVSSLDGVDLPTLIVEEDSDRCWNSPVPAAEELAASSGASAPSKPELVLVPPKAPSAFESDSCGWGSAHEFFDTEDYFTVGTRVKPINADEEALLAVITRWIQARID